MSESINIFRVFNDLMKEMYFSDPIFAPIASKILLDDVTHIYALRVFALWFGDPE